MKSGKITDFYAKGLEKSAETGHIRKNRSEKHKEKQHDENHYRHALRSDTLLHCDRR